jgi:hypothetical protein
MRKAKQLIWWSKCDVKLVPLIPRPTEQTDPLIPPNELAMFEPIHSTTKDINMVVRRQ